MDGYKKMKYINTTPVTAHLRDDQREILEKIRNKAEMVNEVKIPLTEIIRQVIDKGISSIKEDKEIIFQKKNLKME